eukprot:9497203-Pyramimonas_sp.AAC.2
MRWLDKCPCRALRALDERLVTVDCADRALDERRLVTVDCADRALDGSLARQAVEALEGEMEDMDVTLNESILESIRGKKKKSSAETKRKRVAAGEEEEEDEVDSDDDDFYDRAKSKQVGGA